MFSTALAAACKEKNMMKKQLVTIYSSMILAASVTALTPGTVQGYLKADMTPIGPGDTPDYLTTPNWAYSPPLRKFVDTLPGLGPANANNLGQYIPVAVPDTVTYPGSDYYEIALVEYTEQMHSDLPPTTLRGYVQLNDAQALAEGPHFLGPIIVADENRPVRIKFVNMLPTGAGGDLFIPVDTSIMGSGPYTIDYDPVTKDPIPEISGTFTQNRGVLHLHGGRNPWISDGTPHQWITPAGETTDYPTGVSVSNVPDMPAPGPGEQTYFWTNMQSSRMMFYHDHSWGITRLNVYVGEAAGYLIRDDVEKALIAANIIPSGADEIPLVIQDKSYVDAATITGTDPTWNWGTTPGTPNTGDLWWPHVYMPAQNPFDVSGIAPMGRWAYGPWFWPPTTDLPPGNGPQPNPYYNPDCNPDDPTQNEANTQGYTTVNGLPFCQPPEIPGTPNPSWGAEAFMDTPVVNGTAYPVLNVDPKAYRLRILNAAHDRFFNLQMYEAASSIGPGCPTCASETEVTMVAASDYSTDPILGLTWPETWPADGREGGVPLWTSAGPDWIQIGTEGGFLPRPVVIPNHPVTWNNDVTTFNAGNVNGGSLILGPAERADVIVDFSAYAGRTLILYNDAPAPWPALDPHYDYYTGSPDLTGIGGAPSTPVGFGPNTRTIMKIVVADGPVTPYNLQALQDEFDPTTATATVNGVFGDSQDPIVVGQGDLNPTGDPAKYEAFLADGVNYGAYNSAYNTTFPTTFPNWGISRIQDNFLSFMDLDGMIRTVYMEPKAIQDEMGEVYDEYGRMSAKLGLELAFTAAGVQTFVVQNFVDPPTEIVNPDEIQIWKITHNGVDTHPVHFHLYDVQVINRVGWDGFIRLPDPTELGWKDTVRISPLEDTIVALRPVTPRAPFGVPESIRPLNPKEPLGSTVGFSNLDPFTADILDPPTTNQMNNYDWEYVWHCHILSHEENDMMRSVVFQFPESVPDPVSDTVATLQNPNQALISWTDPTPAADPASWGNPANEIGFRIERSTDDGPFVLLAETLANATAFTDSTVVSGERYRYNVVAYNAAGVSPAACAAVGDVNNDGLVGLADFVLLRSNWGQPGGTIPGDLDGNGIVNLLDFVILRNNWSAACP